MWEAWSTEKRSGRHTQQLRRMPNTTSPFNPSPIHFTTAENWHAQFGMLESAGCCSTRYCCTMLCCARAAGALAMGRSPDDAQVEVPVSKISSKRLCWKPYWNPFAWVTFRVVTAAVYAALRPLGREALRLQRQKTLRQYCHCKKQCFDGRKFDCNSRCIACRDELIVTGARQQREPLASETEVDLSRILLKCSAMSRLESSETARK
jgi:hypothetical protein